MEDVTRFKGLMLGVGVEFIHKLKKLAADRSEDGSPLLTNEAAVRELVRVEAASTPRPELHPATVLPARWSI